MRFIIIYDYSLYFRPNQWKMTHTVGHLHKIDAILRLSVRIVPNFASLKIPAIIIKA